MDNSVGFAAEIGVTIAVLMVGGVFFGLWLNAKFNMAPWGILIGMMAGIVLATTVLIIRTKAIMKE
jgi:F0F1-type ATP synthase assembly protein I